MVKKDDWRLLNDVDFLKEQYIEPTDNEEICANKPELKHCIFCLTKVPERLKYYQQWYVPHDKSCCICEDCFNEFRNDFGWRLLDGWDIEW